MDGLQDKVVIVTGGSSGIGLETARRFLAAGANVLITGRRKAVLENASLHEPNLATLVADACNPADAGRTVAFAIARWGRLDVLVNNAGAGRHLPLAAATADQIDAIFAANVVGPTLLASAALPYLVESEGNIINVSSTLAQKPVPEFSAYAASKAALEQLTRCWALELAPRKVRVNAVASGPVESAFLRDQMGLPAEAVAAIKKEETNQIPLGRRGEPGDVAAWIVALAGPSAAWVTGQVLGVDGGLVLV